MLGDKCDAALGSGCSAYGNVYFNFWTQMSLLGAREAGPEDIPRLCLRSCSCII